jgi:hypothetical protein
VLGEICFIRHGIGQTVGLNAASRKLRVPSANWGVWLSDVLAQRDNISHGTSRSD